MEKDNLLKAKELEISIDKTKRQIRDIENLLSGDYILGGCISGRKKDKNNRFKYRKIEYHIINDDWFEKILKNEKELLELDLVRLVKEFNDL